MTRQGATKFRHRLTVSMRMSDGTYMGYMIACRCPSEPLQIIERMGLQQCDARAMLRTSPAEPIRCTWNLA